MFTTNVDLIIDSRFLSESPSLVSKILIVKLDSSYGMLFADSVFISEKLMSSKLDNLINFFEKKVLNHSFLKKI
jgi:hypothetical protein